MSPSGETIFYSPDTKKCITCPFLKISCSKFCIRPQQVSPTELKLDIPDEKTPDYAILELTYDHIDNLIYHCLEKENDWYVLTGTLNSIKKRLCNKQLLQKAETNLICLADQLIKLVNSDYSERVCELSNVPQEFGPYDLKARVYPVLVRLIPYLGQIYIEKGNKELPRKVIDALIDGLKPKLPKFAKTCIEGLTLMLFEIPNLMVRPLQNIILRISTIAAERSLALPTLTFLSSLAQCSDLCKNFKEHDYKTLISVILPYTDPVKFEVFTIHFAHVVVCDWFIRCHYKHRPPFKGFILGQLRATVKSVHPRSGRSRSGSLINSGQLEKSENLSNRLDKRKQSADSREKSLSRPRSGDFGRLSGSSTPRGSTRSTTSQDSAGKVPDPDSITAHKMLIDVTEDLLERWMFSGRCNIIKKSPQLDLLFANKITKTWIVGNTLITISTSKSCDDLEPESCKRCKMVQAVYNGGSFGSNSPQNSQDYGISQNIKIPIPGYREKTRSISLNKIITPKCSCWCKDWAHVEVRSPTANSSMVLRLQNKCQFVNFDATTGGDCHLVTSIFDDDLTELLIKDIQTDYTEPFLESVFDSNSSSSGSKKMKFSRRRRMSNPDTDEMTPTPAIEMRPRAVSDPTVTEKSESFKDTFCEPNSDLRYDIQDSSYDHTITEADFNAALGNMRPRTNQTFSYAKNRIEPNQEHSNNSSETPLFRLDDDLNGLQPLSNKSSYSSVHSNYGSRSPATSRSSSSHDTWSRSSSTRDCSKVPTDTDHSTDVDPAFIFRQLYPVLPHNTENTPLCLPETEELSRTLRALDLILVSNTHKIGVIYLGPGQNKELNILRNTYGSERYMEFLKQLGDMVWLQHCDQSTVYIGGLDTKGADGDYAISWRDKTTQIVFHVATMMPQHDTDPTSTNKKRHIGNNFVTIVYNNSGLPYQQGTIKGQLNFCNLVIEPKTCGMNLVSFMSTKKTALDDLKPHGSLLVNDKPLPHLVRQLAVNANSLCQVIQGTSTQSKNAYYCNWLERLKKIQKIQMRPITPVSSPSPSRKTTFQ